MTTTIEITEAPVIANLDDIDRQFAARAFNNTSFDPDRRGEQRREEYVEHINGLYAEMWEVAKTDEQRAILAEEMERYRKGYIGHLNAYLASHSRVASSMITGPARFPVAQMEKRNRSVDLRVSEWLEWKAKAKKAILSKLMDARSGEVKASAEWLKLRRDILESIATIAKIDSGAEFYTRSAFVNSIAGKAERLAKNGEVDLVEKAIECVQACNAQLPKPAIGPKHKFWTFGELARANAAKHEGSSNTESEVIAKGDGVEIIANHADNRVQIMFDTKPDYAMITKLKGQGWRWAPSVGAWQRRLTNAARYSAIQLAGASKTNSPRAS